MRFRSRARPARTRWCTARAATAAIASLMAARVARAQDVAHRFAIRGEGGMGALVSPQQQSVFGYGTSIHGLGHVDFTLIGPLALQIGGGGWYFFSSAHPGQVVMVGGGLRFEPTIGQVGRLFVDIDVGPAITGGDVRVMIDPGIGFEFAITRWLGLGPVARYGRIFAAANDVQSDPQFVSGGLSLSLRPPPSRPVAAITNEPFEPPVRTPTARPAGDADHDGVPDRVDQCPSRPAGHARDPQRAGCPLPDRDYDGVRDSDDRCPDVPQDVSPDPTRPGCPDPDGDGDGVPDHTDACPAEPAGVHRDPARAGCPVADRDHDQVPDTDDHCPDEAGAPSTEARHNGCPRAARIRRDGAAVELVRPLTFARRSAHLAAAARTGLAAVADIINAVPSLGHITIDVHADPPGGAHETALAQQRAEALRSWLIAHGVDATRLTAHASAPAAAASPRVEFVATPAHHSTGGSS
jgi:outer membrane protein OmpA-like peptidoglycan-associated protein